MKTIDPLLLGLILTLSSPQIGCRGVPQAQHPADVLLPCEYVLLEPGATGLSFTRQKVTLVLRNLTVTAEEPSETMPEYQTPEDTEVPIFEATVNLPLLPFSERLLHVECDGEEIVCEITPLYSQFFIAHIRLPELNIALVTKAESAVDPDKTLDEKKYHTVIGGSPGVLRSTFTKGLHLQGSQADLCSMGGRGGRGHGVASAEGRQREKVKPRRRLQCLC